MKKTIILHPFLFSLLPVSILYSINKENIPAQTLIIPILAILMMTLAVILLLRVFFKNWVVSGLVSTPLILVILTSGRVYEYFSNILSKYGNHQYLMGLIAIIAVIILSAYYFLLHKSQKDKRLIELNQAFNIVASAFLIFNLINILFHKNIALSEFREDIKTVSLKSDGPDIYFIILDQYASIRGVKKVFGYDNSAFSDWLKAKGFYIADESKTRYVSTDASLAKTLNLGNIGLKPDVELKIDEQGQFVPTSKKNNKYYLNLIIHENKVAKIFKSFGYKFINLGSWYSDTNYNKYADKNINCFGFKAGNEMEDLLIRGSVLRFALIPRNVFRNSIIYEFEELSEISKESGPKFVFAHFLIPHMPYVFGANGEKIPFHLSRDFKNKSLYVGQYVFTTGKVKELVGKLLLNSKIPPVIIIQSDHGSRASAEYVHNIFNAVYLPKNGEKYLYKNISAENVFRLILNYYFGQSLKMSEDY